MYKITIDSLTQKLVVSNKRDTLFKFWFIINYIILFMCTTILTK